MPRRRRRKTTLTWRLSALSSKSLTGTTQRSNCRHQSFRNWNTIFFVYLARLDDCISSIVLQLRRFVVDRCAFVLVQHSLCADCLTHLLWNLIKINQMMVSVLKLRTTKCDLMTKQTRQTTVNIPYTQLYFLFLQQSRWRGSSKAGGHSEEPRSVKRSVQQKWILFHPSNGTSAIVMGIVRCNKLGGSTMNSTRFRQLQPLQYMV